MIRCKLIESSLVGTSQATANVGRVVSGETLSIGRAASSKVYVPDPSIRLEHASIHRAEDGFLYLHAAGPVLVNQQLQTDCRLELGQTIAMGPYSFHLDLLEDGPQTSVANLTLIYSVDEATTAPGQDVVKQLQTSNRAGFFQRRWMAWLLAFFVALFCAALPIWKAYQPSAAAAEPRLSAQVAVVGGLDTFWNPGRISSAHQNFGNACSQCHQKPFQRVADTACQACHISVGSHIADPHLEKSTFDGQRCASCHKDHQGSDGMKTVDALGCVSCHADVKRYAVTTHLPDIADFADSHPAFRLSIKRADAKNKEGQVERFAQVPSLKNKTGLKFPHDIHMAKTGIKSPQGPSASQGRVVLECGSCHSLDAAGVRYAPVNMEQHCQGCHQLGVDPQSPQRQVPHAKPAVVALAVRDIYASLAIDRFPSALVTVDSLLQRPAGQAPASMSSDAGRWVENQTRTALVSMLEKPKGVCLTCHEVKPQPREQGGPAQWDIAPIVFTQHWLPKSEFSHAQHKNADCADCHAATKSQDSSDILIPDIETCKSCHTGLHPDKNKVVSTCDSCHGFHAEVQHPIFKESARLRGLAP